MKTYHVFRHHIRGYEAVKIGFSWPAFFWGLFSLGYVWLAAKRLWLLAVIWLGLYVAVGAIEVVTDYSQAAPAHQNIVRVFLAAGHLFLWLIPAFKGFMWRIMNLNRRGFQLVGQFEGKTAGAVLAQVVRPQSAEIVHHGRS